MFQPSKEDVRNFFCTTWRKQQDSGVLTPLESIAARWIVEHTEYHDILNHPERALQTDYSVENCQTNPFLHLSMHLTLSEQIQANQPVGIREIGRELMIRMDSEHDAAHQMMECLGQFLWESAQTGEEPQMYRYLESLNQLI